MVVLFALILVVLAATAGLLLDGGMASATRRQAQAAADTAALAAARATGSGQDGTATARDIAAVNGFPASTPDCAGATITGVEVNRPPLSGAYTGNTSYVEVIARRAMRTGFAGLIGQNCWMVSARAVAVVDGSAVSPCTFCSLNNTEQNHTLVLKNGATLRVDGEIYVNSRNGSAPESTCNVKSYEVCGDGFDVFGAGGYISAKQISTVGGWETHDGNVATADGVTPGCETYTPTMQAQTSNVCIHMPVMADPLNDPANPGSIVAPPAPGSRPIAGQNGCPAYALSSSGTSSSPAKLEIAGGTPTICPGTYYGGIRISNNASVTMLPGIYIIVGGGFALLNNASIDGSSGVMIYNSSGSGTAVNTTAGTSSVPGPVAGKIDPKNAELKSSDSTSSPGQTVTFTFTIEKNGSGNPVPTGTVNFYDGEAAICGGVALVPVGDGKKASATCSQTYSMWGTRAINAIYHGDSVYNAAGDAMTQTITAPSGNIAPITITTTGTVKLTAPTAGSYSGLTLFQDRTSNLVVTLQPGGSGVSCPADYMTADLSNPTGWKTGCGAVGGLRGTVYTAHEDALVFITASGLAQLQVVAGMIQVDSGANARFGWHSTFFAGGTIHLAE